MIPNISESCRRVRGSMGSAVNSSWSCVPEQTDLKVGRNGVPAVIRGKHDSAEGVHILYKNMK